MDSALIDRAILPKCLTSSQTRNCLRLALQNAICNFTIDLDIIIPCHLKYWGSSLSSTVHCEGCKVMAWIVKFIRLISVFPYSVSNQKSTSLRDAYDGQHELDILLMMAGKETIPAGLCEDFR